MGLPDFKFNGCKRSQTRSKPGSKVKIKAIVQQVLSLKVNIVIKLIQLSLALLKTRAQVRLGSYADSVFLGKIRQFLGINNNDVTLLCDEVHYCTPLIQGPFVSIWPDYMYPLSKTVWIQNVICIEDIYLVESCHDPILQEKLQIFKLFIHFLKQNSPEGQLGYLSKVTQ